MTNIVLLIFILLLSLDVLFRAIAFIHKREQSTTLAFYRKWEEEIRLKGEAHEIFYSLFDYAEQLERKLKK